MLKKCIKQKVKIGRLKNGYSIPAAVQVFGKVKYGYAPFVLGVCQELQRILSLLLE